MLPDGPTDLPDTERLAYSIGVPDGPQPYLDTLQRILKGAGITWTENDLYVGSTFAKWEGENRLAVEVRPGVNERYTIFVHPQGNPYFGATKASTVKDAVQLLKAMK